MLPEPRSPKHSAHPMAVLAVCLVVLAAAAPAQPDAVLVTEAEPRLMCSLVPVLTQVGNPPLIVHATETEPYIVDYLNQINARRVWLIDPSGEAPAKWRERFQTFQDPAGVIALELTRQTWRKASAVVLTGDPDDEGTLAACLLATARGVPAFWFREPPDAGFWQRLQELEPSEIVLVGESAPRVRRADFPGYKFTELKTRSAVFAAYEAALGDAPIEHLVVLGPRRPGTGTAAQKVAALVPQYAVRHRAAVAILEDLDDLDERLRTLLSERYASVKYVTLWGDTESLPDVEVEDPVTAAGLETRLTDGKLPVPPLSGLLRREVCQFRVGRITGDSCSAVSLLLARNLRGPPRVPDRPPHALILANLDNELPLMETITRTTAGTFEHAGWRVEALYGWRAASRRRAGVRWGSDVVLYEGHTANLDRAVAFDHDRDPVAAGLYVFQGCRTLIQPQVAALVRNGAAGVVGTTTKTYSASGSSLAKAFVDAMLLDEMDAGTSLMVSRNFMLAVADLGERRQHRQTSKILRGGMTFALWGDPAWKPPASPARIDPSHRVHAVRSGSAVELKIPAKENWSRRVEAGDYGAQIPIGAKLAGWYEWEDDERTRRQLPPLYFAVVPLPDYSAAEPPKLSTQLAANRWTSVWDARNRWLYLLVHGTARSDRDEGKTFRFRIEPAAP